ncbi:hypothetical protein RHGRI_001602 [Rhododendron griersonianum]|uniref:Uncharacterized protein n=1 Tax=Rhododendron griersonianum TaxID=479676 RepID=A0AAV6LNS0_9ERIC|nr:hypothetical protein RHGRI_001602 [Rhododendron griersonianum]
MVILRSGLETPAVLPPPTHTPAMAENLLNTGPILAEGDGSSTQGGDATMEVLQAVRDGQNQMIAAMAALTEAITLVLPAVPVVPLAVPPIIAQPPPATATANAAAAANPANPLPNHVQNPPNPQTGGPAPLTAHAASPSEVSWTLSFDGAAGGAHGGAGILSTKDHLQKRVDVTKRRIIKSVAKMRLLSQAIKNQPAFFYHHLRRGYRTLCFGESRTGLL